MMKDPFLSKEKIIFYITRYKVYIAIGSALTLLLGVGIFQYNYLQMSYFAMQKNTISIVNVMNKQVGNVKEQEKAYFRTGVDYLLKEMGVEAQSFFERNLLNVETRVQEQILKKYNEKELFFSDHQNVLLLAAHEKHQGAMREYFKRMDENKREIILREYFGEEVKLTQDTVTKLYHIAKLYPSKLKLERFTMSMYDLLDFPHAGNEESMALKVLSIIEPQRVYEELFKELKTREVDLEHFKEWVEVLNRHTIISRTEYAGFTNHYTSITQLKNQYKQVKEQRVDIENMRKSIDLQTLPLENQVSELTRQIEFLTGEGAEKDKVLTTLTAYKTVELYIVDAYGEGLYEAATPEKSWFFNTYKPSSERMAVRLTRTKPGEPGVYTLQLYDKGKAATGLPYFEEVSAVQLNEIDTLKSELEKTKEEIEVLEETLVGVEGEIAKIRSEGKYEQNMQRLEELDIKEENIQSQLQEQVVRIQTLFGIKQITMEIE
jgi:hypothetical protein